MMEFILWVIFTKIVSKVVIIKKLWLFYWWLLLMIIDDYWWLLMIICYWWLLLMIIKKDCNKTNCSSIYKEVIRSFFILFIFFYDKISQAPKGTKRYQIAPNSTKYHQKAPKGTKRHQRAPKSITNLKFIDTRFIDST